MTLDNGPVNEFITPRSLSGVVTPVRIYSLYSIQEKSSLFKPNICDEGASRWSTEM